MTSEASGDSIWRLSYTLFNQGTINNLAMYGFNGYDLPGTVHQFDLGHYCSCNVLVMDLIIDSQLYPDTCPKISRVLDMKGLDPVTRPHLCNLDDTLSILDKLLDPTRFGGKGSYLGVY